MTKSVYQEIQCDKIRSILNSCNFNHSEADDALVKINKSNLETALIIFASGDITNESFCLRVAELFRETQNEIAEAV